jgi:hypothetical protein
LGLLAVPIPGSREKDNAPGRRARRVPFAKDAASHKYKEKNGLFH